LFALRQSNLAQLEKDCPDKHNCGESNQETYDRVKFYGVAAPVAAGIGAAAIGTAVVLILTEKEPEKKPVTQKAGSLGIDGFVPTAGPSGSFGAWVSGHF
jgi:hypothetical protein